MKIYWLRGMLLGVSLALLLASGVALAQEITITTDPEGCLECYTRADPHSLSIRSSGWLDNETITFVAWYEGEQVVDPCTSCGQAVDGVFNSSPFVSISCPGTAPMAGAYDVAAQQFDRLGTWRFGLIGDESERKGSFTIEVAEVCGVEFVPEPGTIALLGSGLAGLAGYAALRWRARS